MRPPRRGKALSATILSDTRVVDTSRLLWWPLLRGVILPIRSPRVAKLYQSVWMEEGSPLMVYSRRQQQALAARLPDMPVALGMSYGKPSLESAVDDCWRRAWTISWCWRSIRNTPARRWPPSGTSWRAFWRPAPFRVSPLFATTPDNDYIQALANSVRASFAVHGEPDLLLLSYHGIPQRFANEGDDYPQRCRDTTRELVSALGCRRRR
jgi:ferrochelatase